MTTQPSNFRIEVSEAAALIESRMPHFPSERVSIDEVEGRILRQQVTAERDQPPFDRVTMDGIAISHEALDSGQRNFTVRGTQAAGAAAMKIENPRDCIEIMTGGVLPTGADTIIPVERIEQSGDQVSVEAGYVPSCGQFIHRKGSDHPAGRPLLEPGLVIGAPEMAVLTISVEARIQVARWPRIAVISTGDELVDVDEKIESFQIRSSNDRAIQAALQKRGCRTSERSRLPDDAGRLATEIGKLHAAHEVLILSGGVSMGKYDYVPQILDQLEVELVFHKILQRPGLPMWFGVSAAGKPVFALPGNPVSALVCLVRYVLPSIHKAMGAIVPSCPVIPLSASYDFKPDLTCFLPVQLAYEPDGRLEANPRPTNTSGDFVSLAGTDGVVELARGREDFPAGYPAPFFPW